MKQKRRSPLGTVALEEIASRESCSVWPPVDRILANSNFNTSSFLEPASGLLAFGGVRDSSMSTWLF
jgi:hypothetical protein